MNPIILIKDYACTHYRPMKSLLQISDYKSVTGPDGVVYPFILEEVPWSVESAFLGCIEHALGQLIQPTYIFARAMPEGTVLPHHVHSDATMGAFTAHLCFSSGGETSFVTHDELGPVWESGMVEIPQHGWDEYVSYKHRENRLMVHHAAPFHCAKPHCGFGTLGKDARLVLTCFFNVT